MLIHLAVYYPESLYPLQIRNGIIKGLQIFAVLDLASLHKKIEINKKDRIHVCTVNNLKYVYFFLFLRKKNRFKFFCVSYTRGYASRGLPPYIMVYKSKTKWGCGVFSRGDII